MHSNENGNRHQILQFNIATSLLAVLNRNDVDQTNYSIAKYLLENFDKLSTLSIYQVAEDCYVSRSSVQRFITMIGFSSFTALKEKVSEVYVHQKSFFAYTDHTNYNEYIKVELNKMLENINATCHEQDLPSLAKKIHDSKRCVLLSAEDSKGSLHTFQQSLVLSGKLIYVITNTSSNTRILSELTEQDVLITCSASGNFALAINLDMKNIPATKVLITLNRTLLFESIYNKIFYLSKDVMPSSREITAIRNVYTRYGITYFLDLLYHTYFTLYQAELLRF